MTTGSKKHISVGRVLCNANIGGGTRCLISIADAVCSTGSVYYYKQGTETLFHLNLALFEALNAFVLQHFHALSWGILEVGVHAVLLLFTLPFNAVDLWQPHKG